MDLKKLLKSVAYCIFAAVVFGLTLGFVAISLILTVAGVAAAGMGWLVWFLLTGRQDFLSALAPQAHKRRSLRPWRVTGYRQ